MRRCLRRRAIVPRLHIEASGLHPSRFVSVQYLPGNENPGANGKGETCRTELIGIWRSSFMTYSMFSRYPGTLRSKRLSARTSLPWKAVSHHKPTGIIFQRRSEEHTSELQSLMRISYEV